MITTRFRPSPRWLLTLLLLLSIILSLGAACVAQDDRPLYLTIIIHNEEDRSRGVLPKANIPDYDGDPALMAHFADAMRAFAQMAADHGAFINFGSDWTFSRGVALHEPDFYADLESLGHEIDAHAHESSVLYKDVREAIVLAAGHPTAVASGMNEETIHAQLAYFAHRAPEFEILWGIALPGHVAGECVAPWVWRPSFADWTVHDPNGEYIYIGHGDLLNSLDAIEAAIENRDPNRINTYAVFASPREFKAAAGAPGIAAQWTAPTDSDAFWRSRIGWWDEFLSQIDVWVAEGLVEYASLTEIAAIFEEAEPDLVFEWEDVPRSDLPMFVRSRKSGYPLD